MYYSFAVYICNDESCSNRTLYRETDYFIRALEHLMELAYGAVLVGYRDNRVEEVLVSRKDGRLIYSAEGRRLLVKHCLSKCIVESSTACEDVEPISRKLECEENRKTICYNTCMRIYGAEP